MKILKVARAAEWWEYKLPPILVAAYLVLLISGIQPGEVFPSLLLILASLIIGSAYVSILNDFTDIDEDYKAGKTNRMASYSKPVQYVLLSIALMCAIACCWFLRTNIPALVFYIAAYLSYHLYSLHPFRLKSKGVAGIIADAAGSQLFPTLFVALVVAGSFYKIPVYIFILLGIWSFCFGLRGILWHQFHDVENDKRSGLVTVCYRMTDMQIKNTGNMIIIVEVTSLALCLFYYDLYICLLSFLLYILYIGLEYKTAVEIVILRNKRQRFQIFLGEYYRVFLTISLLISASIYNPVFLWWLLIHVLVFPMGASQVIKNIISDLSIIYQKYKKENTEIKTSDFKKL